MSMSLQDIIGEANAVHQDHLIQSQHDKIEDLSEDLSSAGTKEALASLITHRLEDLYGAASSDETNLSRIATGLQFDVDALSEVVQHLQTLRWA